MRKTPVLALLAGLGLPAVSCDSCGGGSGGGGSWLVGQSGLMVGVNTERPGERRTYALKSSADLLDIACRGELEALVVGQNGLLLLTTDAGETWQELSLGVTQTLRSVTTSEGSDVALSAGDGGVIFLSRDAGRSWSRVTSAPSVDWSAVAVAGDGMSAILAGLDGSLWRYGVASDRFARAVQPAGGPLHGVAFGAAGDVAVAVGDGGLMLESADSGATWTRRSLGTTRALHDIWLSSSGAEAVAVGDSGTIVTVSRDGTPAVRVLEMFPESVAFRGIHLEASGHGMVVGDAGNAFVTRDGGKGWTRLETGDTRTINAVDALESGPHL